MRAAGGVAAPRGCLMARLAQRALFCFEPPLQKGRGCALFSSLCLCRAAADAFANAFLPGHYAPLPFVLLALHRPTDCAADGLTVRPVCMCKTLLTRDLVAESSQHVDTGRWQQAPATGCVLLRGVARPTRTAVYVRLGLAAAAVPPARVGRGPRCRLPHGNRVKPLIIFSSAVTGDDWQPSCSPVATRRVRCIEARSAAGGAHLEAACANAARAACVGARRLFCGHTPHSSSTYNDYHFCTT